MQRTAPQRGFSAGVMLCTRDSAVMSVLFMSKSARVAFGSYIRKHRNSLWDKLNHSPQETGCFKFHTTTTGAACQRRQQQQQQQRVRRV
jgi:hypothetical protein